MPNLRIQIRLPEDRKKAGNLSLFVDGQLMAGPFNAVGKADGNTATARGNPERARLLQFGDTPLGGYAVGALLATGPETPYGERSYGPNGAVRLVPTSGEALEASQIGGRSGLLIHGGDLNAKGLLRPTNGCVRISNTDMQELMVAIRLNENPLEACEISKGPAALVTIGTDEGYDEGDPPPSSDIPLP